MALRAKVSKILAYTFLSIFIMNSCRYKRATCEESVKKSKDFEFEMIVNAISWNGNNIKIDGKSVKTDQGSTFF